MRKEQVEEGRKVLVFHCNWAGQSALEEVGRRGESYSCQVLPVRVPCVGRLHAGMVLRALEAAERLADEGVSVEVIDLRTLKPLDMDTIAASVKKTGRVVGITEAYKTGSFISELATCIQEELFDWLDAPITRVAAADVPVPMSEALEDAAIPSVDAIVAAIRDTLR